MYVETNTEARSLYHCYNQKTSSISYSERVSVVLIIQHDRRMRRITISCVLSDSTIFFHVILQ